MPAKKGAGWDTSGRMNAHRYEIQMDTTSFQAEQPLVLAKVAR